MATVSGDPLTPQHLVTDGAITVWRLFPPTPCTLNMDNPTCPSGDGIPATVNDICFNKAVCNPLSAAELLPPNKKIIETDYYVAEGNQMGNPIDPHYGFVQCIISTAACNPIYWARWEQTDVGYGHFKNWASRPRTAAIVAKLASR